jgi:hypothetical protein
MIIIRIMTKTVMMFEIMLKVMKSMLTILQVTLTLVKVFWIRAYPSILWESMVATSCA